MVRIGISMSFMAPDWERPLFRGKRLPYIEERLTLSVARAGAVPVPLVDLQSPEGAQRVLAGIDGVVFSGGLDISPRCYGEEPLNETWPHDPMRDRYELELVQVARAMGLPLLGICRGAQLLNVALGGTLYQDIATLVPQSFLHRCPERYDQLEHPVHIEADTWLAPLYAKSKILVNSVHHQAVAVLAPGLTPMAQAPDGITEAFQKIDGQDWLVGIQWHPEWLDEASSHRAEGNVIFSQFVQACHQRKLDRLQVV